MEKKTKKKLLIAGVILVVIAIVATVVFYVAVNMAFSKVTQTISDSDLLRGENGYIELPVISKDDGAVAENESMTVQLTPEMMKELDSKISVADKLAVLTILANALPPEEYDKLMDYLSGGVSQEEISGAYETMRQNLTQEQKDQIKSYYAKYMHLLEE